MNPRWLVAPCFLLALAGPGSAAGGLPPPAAQEKKELRWGTDPTGGAPYVYQDNQGRYVGFEVELAEYLASKLGYRIAEVPVAWVDAPGSKVDTTKEVQRFLRDLLKIKWNDLRGLYAHS